MSWDFRGIVEGNLAETMKNFFRYCSSEYEVEGNGCNEIVRVWNKNKGQRFDELFKNHPDYVEGEHCLVVHSKWLRNTNAKEIERFWSQLRYDCRKIAVYEGKDKNEWYYEYCHIRNIFDDYIRYIPANVLNYHQIIALQEQKAKAYKLWETMTEFTPESDAEYKKRQKFVNVMKYVTMQYADEDTVEAINSVYPEVKAVVGQKVSKIARKWFKLTELDKEENFEHDYARYADAINPLEVPELLVISWNPMDYPTMSFGPSWTSCHSTDKENIHDYDGEAANYRGCYSSGTLSYMLDSSSIVVYSLKENATAPYWNNPKVRRQMFHISETGKTFIQGRLYPDDQTDCGNGASFEVYKPWREVMQSIISQAFKIPNLWTNKRGGSNIRNYTCSEGTHYHDYSHYENCNLSTILMTPETIDIGHWPICVNCGDEYNDTDWCWCEVCRNEERYCTDCGRRIYFDGGDDYIEINGDYYCSDCTTYCEYHERRELNNHNHFVHITGYGEVCEDALETLLEDCDVFECEECGDFYWMSRDCYYEDPDTDEIHHYCSSHCLNRNL